MLNAGLFVDGAIAQLKGLGLLSAINTIPASDDVPAALRGQSAEGVMRLWLNAVFGAFITHLQTNAEVVAPVQTIVLGTEMNAAGVPVVGQTPLTGQTQPAPGQIR